LSERYRHVDEYYGLREDIQNIEVLRKGAERVLRESGVERSAVRQSERNI
jgi:hypothetical protein